MITGDSDTMTWLNEFSKSDLKNGGTIELNDIEVQLDKKLVTFDFSIIKF